MHNALLRSYLRAQSQKLFPNATFAFCLVYFLPIQGYRVMRFLGIAVLRTKRNVYHNLIKQKR
ncbi:hypothetical protein CJ216_03700 [Gardnerella greenwoodii]|uniref:Uncharacterized protein n=1 Tax=Gardnerella greenwoodii TaxID=2914925 RepID=A0A2N6RYK0_9BIFI|nr:hypothetical protein CJ216_03700 [Gardnerella greenwoodii]